MALPASFRPARRGSACISCPSRRGRAGCGRPCRRPPPRPRFGPGAPASRSIRLPRRRTRGGAGWMASIGPAETGPSNDAPVAAAWMNAGGALCAGGGSKATSTRDQLRCRDLAQTRDQLVEQLEGFGLIFVQRIALRHAAPADHLAQMVERDEMLAPQMIERLQDDLLFDVAHDVRRRSSRRARHRPRPRLSSAARASPRRSMPSSLAQSASGSARLNGVLDRVARARRCPRPRDRRRAAHVWRRDRRRRPARMSSIISSSESCAIISRRCSNTTLRWSFMTLSYFSTFLRMSKLRASTFCCAFSSALLIQGWTIASSSLRPSLTSMESMRSEPKMRIRSSCSDRKNFDRPGIALAAGAAAQLIVDAAALVPLGADDIEAAGGDRLCLEILRLRRGSPLPWRRARGLPAGSRIPARRASRHCRRAECRCRGRPCWSRS